MKVALFRSLRVRIMVSFSAALLAMSFSQVFLYWQSQTVGRSLELITQGYLPLSKVSAQLQRDIQRTEVESRALSFSGVSPAASLLESVNVGRNVALKAQQRPLISAEEHQVFQEIMLTFDRIDRITQRYLQRREQLQAQNDPDGVDALKALHNGSSKEVDRLERQVDMRIQHLTVATQRAQERANRIAGTLTAIAFAVALGLMGAVLSALSPIRRLVHQVKRLAEGDYSGQVSVPGRNEIALLASEFNTMVRAIAGRDRDLVERADAFNQLNRYLESVLNGLSDGLLVTSDQTITLINPAAERSWGVHKGDVLPSSLITLGQPTEGRSPDGRLHQLRSTTLSPTETLILITDITDITDAQDQLARSKRLALVGQMLAQITHEVRNPLNALSLNAELLGDELLALQPDQQSEVWELFNTVTSEIDRLTELTGHYLQMARRPKAHLEALSLQALLEELIRLLAPELTRESVQLEAHFEPIVDQEVDGNQLKQAMLNLFQNALQANASELQLSLFRTDEGVNVRLQDNGHGMSPEALAQAMDPFFTTKAAGTGLGLAISRQVADLHGGELRLQPSTGGGIIATLQLPYRPAHRR